MVATTAPTIQVGAPAADAGDRLASSPRRSGQRLVPLRLKLGALLGTIAALAVAIPTVLHAIAFVGDQERKVGEDNLELARVVGVLTEGRIEQTFVLLDFVTTAPSIADDVKAGDARRLTDRLYRVVRLDDALSSILIVDRDGVVVAHSMVDKRLVGQSGRSWPQVQQVLDGAARSLGAAIQSPVTGRAVVSFAIPIYGADDELVGAAVAFLSLDRLEAHVNGARGPGRGLARILDGDGRLLTSLDAGQQLTNVAADNPVAAEALRGTPSVGRVQSGTGGTAYAAAIPIASGWVVEVQHPAEAVLAPAQAMLIRSIVIAVGAFAIAMLVGAIAARRFAEPLSLLVSAMRSIRREEGRSVLPRSSTAEVAWLADELGQMRSVLEARTTTMRHALDTLARYRLLVERTTDIVLFVSADRTILDLNAAAERAYGYQRADLVGRSAVELVGDPELRLTDEQLACAHTEEIRFETVHRRQDGTTFPVEVNLVGADDTDTASGPIMMAIVRDITARQAVEAALRASEAKYRNVVDTIKDVVFQVDADDHWTFLNPAWTEVTEFGVEETLGQRVIASMHPDDRARSSALYDSLIRQRTSVARFEARFLTRSGGTRWLEIYANLTFSPDGAYLGASGTLADVTDRRHAEAARERMLVREQEARASEERAAEVTGIVKHMPCGVLVFDTDSCLTLANERALEMLSPYPSVDEAAWEEGIAPHPSALLDERMLNPCRALVARALGGSAVSDRELQVDGPDGDDRVLVGSAVPLRSAHGEVRGAVAILTDVTRERRLMESLVQSEGTLRHSLESLLVLHEASRALGSTLLGEEIGRRLVESCVRVARLDAALVFIADDHGGARLLGAHGDPVLIEHVLACRDERRAREAALSQPESAGLRPVRSCAELSLTEGHHVELAARGRTLGVLEIYGTEQRAAITEDALASLAAHAVSAFENARLYREVGDREQRLQDALRQLLIAQEDERRRVAYELHDGLAQVAAATHLSLQTFASQYRTRSEQKQRQLDRSVDLARRVVREARQVIAGLRPTILDDFGLERALRLHVHELENDGWTISYEPQLGSGRLPGPIETVLYRIAQEALTNVRKHADTLSATVRLGRHDGLVELEIVDRGVGFEKAAPAADDDPGHHIGLVGMRERAALVGGRCVIESEPGQGTRVAVTIPLPAQVTPGEAALVAVGA